MRVIKELIDIQYNRNEMDFHRGTFRVRGDVLEIFPANYSDRAIRVEFFGDEIDRITEVDVLTGEIHNELKHAANFSGISLRCSTEPDPEGCRRNP